MMWAVSAEDFYFNLATAASTLLTVAIAILAFIAQRAVARSRRELGVYAFHLGGVFVIALYTLVCDGLAWWAWARAAPGNPELLFGWPLRVWLWLLFLPPALFAGSSGLFAAFELARRVRRRVKEGWRP